MAVDDPNPPYGPSSDEVSFDWTIHQVRDPLKTIASLAQWVLRGRQSWSYISRNVPGFTDGMPAYEIRRESRELLVLAAMRYWLAWNNLSAAKADIRIRLEDLPNQLERLCAQMNITPRVSDVSHIPTSINQRENYIREAPWVVDWPVLGAVDPDLCMAVQQLAADYGYEVPLTIN